MNIVLANQIVSSIPQLQSTCFGSYVNTVFGIPKCNINLSPVSTSMILKDTQRFENMCKRFAI